MLTKRSRASIRASTATCHSGERWTTDACIEVPHVQEFARVAAVAGFEVAEDCPAVGALRLLEKFELIYADEATSVGRVRKRFAASSARSSSAPAPPRWPIHAPAAAAVGNSLQSAPNDIANSRLVATNASIKHAPVNGATQVG